MPSIGGPPPLQHGAHCVVGGGSEHLCACREHVEHKLLSEANRDLDVLLRFGRMPGGHYSCAVTNAD